MSELIAAPIREEILRRLWRLERDEDVQVLFAIESGSRAWGFSSVNSDYDVRFIYRHRADWYLSIEERRDVIEQPIVDDIDLNGWDVRKAIQLLRKTNPAIIEWLNSPIVYIDSGGFAEAMRGAVSATYSMERGIQHYRSMAKTNFREYLLSDEVPMKKYFYVLRPLFAARWVEQFRTAPPIEFERLLPMVSDHKDLLVEIEDLLRLKRAATEKAFIPRRDVINVFIQAELERFEQREPDVETLENALPILNQLFRTTIASSWPTTAIR